MIRAVRRRSTPVHTTTAYLRALTVDGAGDPFRHAWPLSTSRRTCTHSRSTPRNPATVYVGTYDGLFRSTDAGRTWRGSGSGLSAKFEARGASARGPPQGAIDRLRRAVSRGAGVFKSTDSGKSWRSVLRGVVVYALAIDPRTGSVYAATGQGVYRSANGNRRSWEGVFAGRGRVTTLAIDPQRASTVYAGTWSGVFKSVNRGRGMEGRK